jgi:riboflavin biosynthesis pyrimidine reductase
VQILEPGAVVADPLEPYALVDRAKGSAGRSSCWVLAHMVGGLDGSAAVGGRVDELSDASDAQLFLLMRALADVVMVGAETMRREGYGPIRLTPAQASRRRAAGQLAAPALAVVSKSLDLNWASNAFLEPASESRTIVITCEAADPQRLQRAREVARVVVAGKERVDPVLALLRLSELGHRVVLCEGGPHWLGQLVAADLLDELCLSIAPLMGGDALAVSVSPPGAPLTYLKLQNVMRDADTLFLRYERGVQ